MLEHLKELTDLVVLNTVRPYALTSGAWSCKKALQNIWHGKSPR
jgi:hypothetical protein